MSEEQGRHGIESPNLKNEYRAGEGGEEAKPCVEDDCGNRLGDDDGDHDHVEGDDVDYHDHDH